VESLGALTRAVRDISRRKVRASLVIIALSFSIAIMVSIPSGIMANQEAMQSLSESYQNVISNMQAEINKTQTLIECRTSSGRGQFLDMPFGSKQGEIFVNEVMVAEISSIEGVKDVVPFLEVSSEETTSETINTPRGSVTVSRPLYTIMGVPLNSSLIENYSILPTNITVGRNLSEGDSDVILVSSNLSDYLGVGIGDKIEVYGEYFTVVGVYETASQDFTGTRTRTIRMNITEAQRITGNIGNISRIDVYAEDLSYVDSIAEVIEAAYPELYVTTYKDRLENLERVEEMYQTTLENAEATLSQTQTIAFQGILIAIVAASLIVLFMMLYTVRERTKEIGILKAIGFSNWNVMNQFMLEGILLSLIAGVVGVAIGIVGAPFISSLLIPSVNPFSTEQQRFPTQNINFGNFLSQSTSVLPDMQTLLLAFGVAVLLGALGSLYPAWRAARISPMEALRYE